MPHSFFVFAVATTLLVSVSTAHPLVSNHTRRLALPEDFYTMLPVKYASDKIIGTAVDHDCKRHQPDTAISVIEDKTCHAICAQLCFERKSCNYFAITRQKCKFTQHLQLTEKEGQMTAYGYMRVPPPELLNQKLPCTEPNHQLVEESSQSTNNFCTYKTSESGEPVASFFLAEGSYPSEGTCAASKQLLYRAFRSVYFSNEGLKKLPQIGLSAPEFPIPNAAELGPFEFTWEKFNSLTSTPRAKLTVTAHHYEPDDQNMPQKAGGSTKWKYELDAQGRVKSASAELTRDNLLYRVIGDNRIQRKDYCWGPLQSRFNAIHGLSSAKHQWLPFHAGHVVGCQFTNPNGFWNFVVQSPNSNTDIEFVDDDAMDTGESESSKNRGCWYYAENEIAKLLKMGCKGTFTASLQYHDVKENKFKLAMQSGGIVAQKDIDRYYGPRPKDLKLPSKPISVDVTYPCAYTYRPHTMELTFKITGANEADPDDQCAAIVDVLEDGQFFKVVSDEVRITRALAYWAREDDGNGAHTFPGLRGLATTSSGKCYNEFGTKLSDINLLNDFKGVYIQVKEHEGIQCISASTVIPCSAVTKRDRYSQGLVADRAALATARMRPELIVHGKRLAFWYLKQFKPGPSVDLHHSVDDLVDGYLIHGDECAKVTPSGLELVKESTEECSIFQSKYILTDVKVVTTHKAFRIVKPKDGKSADTTGGDDGYEADDEGGEDHDDTVGTQDTKVEERTFEAVKRAAETELHVDAGKEGKRHNKGETQ